MRVEKESGSTMTVMLTAEDRLEPCPFCASKDISLSHTWTPSYWIECGGCGAEMHPPSRGWGKGDDRKPSKHLASARRALKAWNRRAA